MFIVLKCSTLATVAQRTTRSCRRASVPQQPLGFRSDPRCLGRREFAGSLFLGRELFGLGFLSRSPSARIFNTKGAGDAFTNRPRSHAWRYPPHRDGGERESGVCRGCLSAPLGSSSRGGLYAGIYDLSMAKGTTIPTEMVRNSPRRRHPLPIRGKKARGRRERAANIRIGSPVPNLWRQRW
jgi:hypothetical protein